MSSARSSEVLVAGIGNPDRGDDGFAAAVIGRLRGNVPPGVRVLDLGADILGLIDEWDGLESVILVDAAASGAEPGRVHRLDLAAGPLPIGWSMPSTHAVGLGETVELARSLRRLPRGLVLYLVEGESFEVGAPLSSAVAEAVDAVADQILIELLTIVSADQPHRAVSDA